jgi:ribonucleoside-diphosphate reductase alpha chain
MTTEVKSVIEDEDAKQLKLQLENDDAEIAKTIGANGMRILGNRYLRKGDDGKTPVETPAKMFWRVASYVARHKQSTPMGDDVHACAQKYYGIMKRLEFFPNSPTFTGADTPLGQLAACFVLNVEDDMGRDPGAGIFSILRIAALIQQTGGGVGFNFSNLRPRGDIVNSSKGTASGPISFMKVYDAAFSALAQGGMDRGGR